MGAAANLDLNTILKAKGLHACTLCPNPARGGGEHSATTNQGIIKYFTGLQMFTLYRAALVSTSLVIKVDQKQAHGPGTTGEGDRVIRNIPL